MKSLICLLLFFSCTQFIQSTDADYYVENIDSKKSELHFLFSHNINGETHPCGCRNFPLGGIPQVYGFIKSLDQSAPSIYVDSGDTFFPLPIVPEFLVSSSEYTALKIAEAMDAMGLKYFTPGDQDFALGEDFLIKISKKHKFKFLMTNAADKMRIKHLKSTTINTSKVVFHLFGISNPTLMNQHSDLFIDPIAALKKEFANIKKTKKIQKIILLSHAGIDYDKKLAQTFPQIDWIIGAHSQSYLYNPVEEGNTNLVQVLSRNHFLGHIKFSLGAKESSEYKLEEMRDEKKDLIKKNTMVDWLVTYKSELEKIQLKEQGSISVESANSKLPTYISCKECHSKQTEFWQSTSHSIAFQTLVKAKASQNQACIGCHSLGFKEAKGFLSTKAIVISDHKDFDIEKYWAEFTQKHLATEKSIRDLSSKKRKEYSDKWIAFDTKKEVTHNFSNVQCLNCHNQNNEHPFDVETVKLKPDFEKACQKCHTPDQSPEWYNKDSKKLATSINKKYLQKKIRQVSCPKIEKE